MRRTVDIALTSVGVTLTLGCVAAATWALWMANTAAWQTLRGLQ